MYKWEHINVRIISPSVEDALTSSTVAAVILRRQRREENKFIATHYYHTNHNVYVQIVHVHYTHAYIYTVTAAWHDIDLRSSLLLKSKCWMPEQWTKNWVNNERKGTLTSKILKSVAAMCLYYVPLLKFKTRYYISPTSPGIVGLTTGSKLHYTWTCSS